jgi:hypothetical protein
VLFDPDANWSILVKDPLCTDDGPDAFRSKGIVIHVAPSGYGTRHCVELPDERVNGKAKEERGDGTAHVHAHLDGYGRQDRAFDFGPHESTEQSKLGIHDEPSRRLPGHKDTDDPLRVYPFKGLFKICEHDRLYGATRRGLEKIVLHHQEISLRFSEMIQQSLRGVQ